MSIWSRISVLALRPLLPKAVRLVAEATGCSAASVGIDALENYLVTHFSDPSQRLPQALSRAADRVPVFENLAVNPKRAWAGLYEMTPDHHPILGESPEVPGFYFANGFSGHGVMHAPATGKILSDLILTGKTDLIDASLLNFSRFAEGRMIHETAVL